jgi:hypothetical protein
MVMRNSIILAACGLLLLTPVRGEAQDVPDWPGRLGQYVFEVTRDGKPIGTQAVTLKQDGATLTVTTESTIAVKMLGVVVYRMHQLLTETFEGRRMVAIVAETKDPRGVRAGEIRRDGNHWSGKFGKQVRDFDCDCLASTMWQAAGLAGPTIIEASEGRPRAITVEDKGTETLDLPEGKVETHHYAVKGEIAREVWYDASGNLVAAQQVGSDGSQIRQILMRDPIASRETGTEASEP